MKHCLSGKSLVYFRAAEGFFRTWPEKWVFPRISGRYIFHAGFLTITEGGG